MIRMKLMMMMMMMMMRGQLNLQDLLLRISMGNIFCEML